MIKNNTNNDDLDCSNYIIKKYNNDSNHTKLRIFIKSIQQKTLIDTSKTHQNNNIYEQPTLFPRKSKNSKHQSPIKVLLEAVRYYDYIKVCTRLD